MIQILNSFGWFSICQADDEITFTTFHSLQKCLFLKGYNTRIEYSFLASLFNNNYMVGGSAEHLLTSKLSMGDTIKDFKASFNEMH